MMECIWNKKSVKRGTALVMAAVLLALAVPFPLPARASSVWPQKATAPFYCLDGGKGWKQVDRYDIYEYDTLPSPLTETQTKRLFWAYPSNWTALKEAARKFDPELYGEIASTASGPNVVKRVKDDPPGDRGKGHSRHGADGGGWWGERKGSAGRHPGCHLRGNGSIVYGTALLRWSRSPGYRVFPGK